MRPENRIPTHPGEILLEDFIKPLGVTQVEFARHLCVPIQRVNEIVRGRRGVSPDTAWLLSKALGTTPEFWTNLQTAHDLALSRPDRKVRACARHRDATPIRSAERLCCRVCVVRKKEKRLVKSRRHATSPPVSHNLDCAPAAGRSFEHTAYSG